MKALTRRERILFLLEHWQDFTDPSGTMESRGESGGDDGGVALLPKMSRHVSVVELGRCLELCRRMAPQHYRHLAGFYGAEWRTVDRQRRGKTRGGKVVLVMVRERERLTPAWVTPRMVDHAVDFVCGSFNGEVFIPQELMEAA